MKGPNSYTGENVIEINCHGGVLVTKKILELVIENGARLAEPGEFTKRAFLNGKMDLSQAEAVMDLIHSKNDYAIKSSVNQLKGSISKRIKELRDDVLYQIAFIESALDDPEHISLDGYKDQLIELLNPMIYKIENLIQSSDNGRYVSEGIKTVILGKPNAGKSSLLNVLLGEERAIVTHIEGTTRDTLEEQIYMNGISLNIIDTAGIRDTDDIVEQIGVSKAKSIAEKADLIIYVVDSSRPLDQNDEMIMDLIKNKNGIVILNKSDLKMVLTPEEIIKKIELPVITISAKEEKGIDELVHLVETMFYQGNIDFNDEVIITNVRHKNALVEALEALKMVKEGIDNQMPEDFLTIDFMNAYEKLGTILGESLEDDLVNEIFSKFCTGK